MAHFEIELPESTKLARVFFRVPSQLDSFAKLLPSDFERRQVRASKLWREPGISLWRLDLISEDSALANVPSRSKKGMAQISALRLTSLGYHFIASTENLAYISLRCRPCNLSLSFEKLELCQAMVGSCTLGPPSDVQTLTDLAEAFEVTREAG